jgi:segregation and condensation protein B
MKRSWSPTDSFRSAARSEIYAHRPLLGGRAAVARSKRPYDVTQLGIAETDSTVQHSIDPVSAIDAEDEEHPERRRMRAEAVLLVAKTPLSPRKLAQLAHLADATEARTLVRQLNQTYETLGRAIRVEQIAGGFRMMTRPVLAPWLARLGHLPQSVRLSTPMMETLAVVAYRQPVSRANTEAVRGVACGELLRQLMERDLIRIVGRSEELGRPYLYGTTKHFLQLFGLPRIDALPPIQWHAFQEDPTDKDFTPEDSLEDSSTSTKEPVLSTTIAPIQSDAILSTATLATETDLAVIVPPSIARPDAPTAVDEDRDDDDEEEGDDDEWEDEEDWDDDEDDLEDGDEEEVDEEEGDELEDDGLEEDDLDDDDLDDDEDDGEEVEKVEKGEKGEKGDLEDDDWEEVDDKKLEEDEEADDEEWDEEDEEDESAEDDEDWE